MNLVREFDNSSIRFTGAVYTPQKIAAAMLSRVEGLLPDQTIHVLEPSVGDGVFLKEMVSSSSNKKFTVVDIDKASIDQIESQFFGVKSQVEFIADDFINFASKRIAGCDEKFDLIIGNPPFVRKHNFSEPFKENLKTLSELTGYPLKDLKNTWVAFLVAAINLVSANGIVAFILPYELMTVEYGQKVLRAMRDQFNRLDVYISKSKAFRDIDQDAVILIAQRQVAQVKGLFINQVEQMSDLSHRVEHKVATFESVGHGLELNSFLFSKDTLELLRAIRETCQSISDYANSSPGIVSAANEFFILRETDIAVLGLKKYAIPILKKGSFSNITPVFTKKDFDSLVKTEPSYLLNIKGDFSNLDANLQAYIKKGEEKGFHLRYKCRHRKNWYEVPIVSREQGFFFKRSHSFPRVCVNEANVYITDTAYGIKMRSGYTIKGFCYSFYNTLTMLFAETDGRFYGGGVLELSPKEFRGLPLVYQEPSEHEYIKFTELHESAQGDVQKILEFGDKWLQKSLNLNDEQMHMLRQAWAAVRSHRMRHGSRGN